MSRKIEITIRLTDDELFTLKSLLDIHRPEMSRFQSADHERRFKLLEKLVADAEDTHK